MTDWFNVNLEGASRIRKVSCVFEIEDYKRVPYGKYKIKVLEDAKGTYIAFPNIACKNDAGEPEWISGIGATPEEALQDVISRIAELIPISAYCQSDRFEWAAPEDF